MKTKSDSSYVQDQVISRLHVINMSMKLPPLIYTTIKTKDVCVFVCVFVCHVYAGHLPIDGSASYFTQS